MTATLNTNGAAHQRKTLASQLDRLDGILDVLSDGLNEAVADAVRAAVESAVRETTQAVLAELLTNPIVLARLREVLMPPAPVAAPLPPTAAAFASIGNSIVSAAQSIKSTGKAMLARSTQWYRILAEKVEASGISPKLYAKPLTLAAGVGLACGVFGYFANPWCAAITACLAGFSTTLGVWSSRVCRFLRQGTS